MAAYYNEIEPFAAAWLRNLIKAGLIAPGDVDERSIVDVRGGDLRGYTQVHFFAGIGGWSLALRLAGWPDDRPVWTGSCPCQPFSTAGKRRGTSDERHLWPEMRRLVAECRPASVLGEQVASADGRTWLAAVRADLEDLGYAVGAADLCAASVGAPHIRQRLWWVADAQGVRHPQRERGDGASAAGAPEGGDGGGWPALVGVPRAAGRGATGVLAHGIGARLEGRDAGPLGDERASAERGGTAGAGRMEDAHEGEWRPGRPVCAEADRGRAQRQPSRSSSVGFWSHVDWLPCRDGKARPVEPGTFPLAHGIPGRVGRLRAYGNAIVPALAAEFVSAYLDTTLL